MIRHTRKNILPRKIGSQNQEPSTHHLPRRNMDVVDLHKGPSLPLPLRQKQKEESKKVGHEQEAY